MKKQTHYMISDTAKKVDVESHVLRYWEEELGLPIARNEMGHRYYTEADIQLFQNIKCLKDQGFALKAIRLLLPELSKRTPEELSNLFLLREELNRRVEQIQEADAVPVQESDSPRPALMRVADNADADALAPAEQKLLQFQELIGQAVEYSLSNAVGRLVETKVRTCVNEALAQNNRRLAQEMSRQLSCDICEDLDGLLQEREQRDEERYRNLDMAIRERQRAQKEAAVTSLHKMLPKKGKSALFKKQKH